jgi:hypothetical protein
MPFKHALLVFFFAFVAQTRARHIRAEMCNITQLPVYETHGLCKEGWTVVLTKNDRDELVYDVVEMTRERRRVSGVQFACCIAAIMRETQRIINDTPGLWTPHALRTSVIQPFPFVRLLMLSFYVITVRKIILQPPLGSTHSARVKTT